MAKFVIIAFLIAIIAALGSGMVFMLRDDSGSRRTVKALTWRIGLSVALIVVLILCFYFGWLHPHGIKP